MGIGHSGAARTVLAVIKDRRVVRSILNFGGWMWSWVEW